MKGKYLLLGSNLGDRMNNLNTAISAIVNQIGPVKKRSSVFETEPWGYKDQPDYYNQVLEVETNLTPNQMLKEIFRIEKKMGKIKFGKWKERLIDIDILYYDNEVIDTGTLIIPHPHIANRNFTLIPLCEISGNEIHPVLNTTNRELLDRTKDPLQVKKI